MTTSAVRGEAAPIISVRNLTKRYASGFEALKNVSLEILSAPISYVEIVCGYVGAAATKSILLGTIILVTARLFVPYGIAHPVWMLTFLVLTSVTFSMFGFIIGIWADKSSPRSASLR